MRPLASWIIQFGRHEDGSISGILRPIATPPAVVRLAKQLALAENALRDTA